MLSTDAQEEMKKWFLPQTSPSIYISNAFPPTIDLLGGSPRARSEAGSRAGVVASVVTSNRTIGVEWYAE